MLYEIENFDISNTFFFAMFFLFVSIISSRDRLNIAIIMANIKSKLIIINRFLNKSAIFGDKPSKFKACPPTTATEAAADIKFFSVCLNCSILRASIVMSCVDEQIAIKSQLV